MRSKRSSLTLFSYQVVGVDPFYDDRDPVGSFWRDEDLSTYAPEIHQVDGTWSIPTQTGCRQLFYGKGAYVQGLSYDFSAYCGEPIDEHYIGSVVQGNFPSDIGNCDFLGGGPQILAGPEAAAWLVGQRAAYASDPAFGVHIGSESYWDAVIWWMQNNPCTFYAVGATKDSHVNHWDSFSHPWVTDVLDANGDYLPTILPMQLPYLMVVDEPPLDHNETYPWVGPDCGQGTGHEDGLWVDELVFNFTPLEGFVCNEPPPMAVRFRAWDDLGNWKRSGDIMDLLEQAEALIGQDIIFTHPVEGTYKAFHWDHNTYASGIWGGGEVFQQYVNYPNNFVNLEAHEGGDVPINYSIYPLFPGQKIFILGLLDPPMDSTLDDGVVTNPYAYSNYETDINDNIHGIARLEVNGDGGAYFGINPYVTATSAPLPYEYTVPDPPVLPELKLITSAYGGENYQVLIEIDPCACPNDEPYVEESPVINVWRKGFVESYTMHNENPPGGYQGTLAPDTSAIKGAFDDGFFELITDEIPEETYWQEVISPSFTGILYYSDPVEPSWPDYVPFHDIYAFDWEFTKHYTIHLQGIYKFTLDNYWGLTWGDSNYTNWPCIHKHSLVAVKTIWSNYPNDFEAFEYGLKSVSNHEIGRSLGIIASEDECPNGQCVMKEDINVLWLGLPCIEIIRGAPFSNHNPLDEECYIQ